MNDFYFSKKMFEQNIKQATPYDYMLDSYGTKLNVCEVLIDGEWKIFTEQIYTGHEPVTKSLGDLVFVGTQYESQTRYTPIITWLEKNQEIAK